MIRLTFSQAFMAFNASTVLEQLYHDLERAPLALSQLQGCHPHIIQAYLGLLDMGAGLGFWSIEQGWIRLQPRQAWDAFRAEHREHQRALMLSMLEGARPASTIALSSTCLGFRPRVHRQALSVQHDLSHPPDVSIKLITLASRPITQVELALDLFLVELASFQGQSLPQQQLEALWALAHQLPSSLHAWRQAFCLVVLWGWLIPAGILEPIEPDIFEVHSYGLVHGRWRRPH